MQTDESESEGHQGPSLLLLLLCLAAALNRGVFSEVLGLALAMAAVCLLSAALLFPLVSVPLALGRLWTRSEESPQVTPSELVWEPAGCLKAEAPPERAPALAGSPVNYAATAGGLLAVSSWNGNNSHSGSRIPAERK